MSSTTINWDETKPAIGDFISNGPAILQSLQSSLRIGLGTEHAWPSSTGLAGGHTLGSARVFVGDASTISSADTTGRMMVDSTNSELWYVGSDATYPMGGHRVPSMATNFVLSLTSRVLVSVASITQNTWPSGPIGVGPTTGFAGTPYFFASVVTNAVSDLTLHSVTLHSITNHTCVATVWDKTGTASTETVTINIVAVGIQ